MAESGWILVAEDDDNDFALITRAVGKLKIDVELRRAKNGQEAIEILNSTLDGLALILLDIKMPKVSGLDVLSFVRKNEPTRFLPTVMLTSSDEGNDLSEAYRLGCNAYLRKPILYQEFMHVVQATLVFWLQVKIPGPR